jgi:hypothetical protein
MCQYSSEYVVVAITWLRWENFKVCDTRAQGCRASRRALLDGILHCWVIVCRTIAEWRSVTSQMAGILSYTPVKTEKFSTSQSLELWYLPPLQYSRSCHALTQPLFSPRETKLSSILHSPLFVNHSLTTCFPTTKHCVTTHLTTLTQSNTTLSLTLCHPKLANLRHLPVFHCGTSQFTIITVTKSLTTLLSFSHSSLLPLTHHYVLQSLITLTHLYPYSNIGNVLNLVSEWAVSRSIICWTSFI